MKNLKYIITSCTALLASFMLHAQETRELAIYRPYAVADLRTSEGRSIVHASWKITNAAIKDISFKSPGPSATDPLPLYPTGSNVTAQDIYPNINDLDNANWQSLDDLEKRTGNGKLSFI